MHDLIERLRALGEAGPSVQKYGVNASDRSRNANAIHRASKLVKSKSQRKVLSAISAALAAGEAKEACLLFSKLNAEGRKALAGVRAATCGI